MLTQKTKIVCTIGPSTWDPKVLKTIIDSGMTVARINASFADAAEIKRVTELVRSLSNKVAVMLDLKGHKIRVSDFPEPIKVNAGEELILECKPNDKYIYVSYENLYKDIKVGAPILIDDGKISLEVIDIKGTQIVCRVKNSGEIKRKKTVNVPGTYLTFDPLTEKDKEDIKAGLECNVDLIAGSFIRDANDIKAIQERIKGTNIGIIAKIEDPLGVQNFDEILQEVYGIMIARGDLAVEVPYEHVPVLQREFVKKCTAAGKPVIVATQMLESMISSPVATRAEVSDIATAVYEGADAIMLSAESSTGTYPVEAVVTMAKVAQYVEPNLPIFKVFNNDAEIVEKFNQDSFHKTSPSAIAITKSTMEACTDLPVKLVIVVSKNGFTARMLSRYKLRQPIYAYVMEEITARKLALSRGIYACVLKSNSEDRDTTIKHIMEQAKEDKIVEKGDLVAIVIGSHAFSGTTSSVLELQKVG